MRTAAGLREDADELMRQTFEVLDDVIDETPEAASTSWRPALLDLPRAIAGRVVANAVYRCGVPCATGGRRWRSWIWPRAVPDGDGI